MRRIKVSVAYIGSGYSGFQKNTDALLPSIQARIEEALARYLGAGNESLGARRFQALQISSRTDAGVHALGNVFHVDILSDSDGATGPLPHASHLVRGLNSILQQGREKIVISDAIDAGPDFCARRSCTGRRYIYKVLCPSAAEKPGRQADLTSGLSPSTALFHRQFCHVIDTPLDVEAMQRATLLLIGEKDFASFRNAGCQSASSFRNLTQLDVASMRCDPSVVPLVSAASPSSSSFPSTSAAVTLVTFTISANAFLLKMVRNLVGVLLEVGEGRIDAKRVGDLLEIRDRSRLGVRPAPANGLTLSDVFYDGAHGTKRHVANK